ncbi:MAG: DUF3727 domain-containing protein [Prochlorothrix sp.]|nr:DUF3727 domain-containing protein [Prochlorothrix sp.]
MTSEMDAPTVLLTDDRGRSLLCSVEHSLTLDGKSYALLLPVHTPVDLFSWDDEDTEDPELVEDETEIAEVFPTAQAVLEEQNLSLQWTAITLTVEGDLPDLDALDWETEFGDDDDRNSLNGDRPDREAELGVNGYYPIEGITAEMEEVEEFRLLARFYHEEQEYGIYIPLTPFLIPVRLNQGNPHLLDPSEFEAIEPLFVAALEEELDSEEN